MKRFALLLFLTGTTLFVSCSDDDDNPFQANESLIPGEWVLTEIKSEDGKASTTIQDIPVSGEYNVSGENYDASVTFTESAVETEPNTVVGSGSFTLVFTFTFLGIDPVEVKQNVPELIGSGDWVVDGNTLTTTVQGEDQSYEIVSLTEQTMTLKVPIDEETEVESPAAGTLTVTVTGDQIFVLTKQ